MDWKDILRAWPYLAAWTLLTYYLISTTRAYFKLREFKGPRVAAFSNLWYIRAAVSGKPHLYLADVCTQYGTGNFPFAGLVLD